MDTSPVYIKMCESAQEIQEFKKGIFNLLASNIKLCGNFFYNKLWDAVFIAYCGIQKDNLRFASFDNLHIDIQINNPQDILIWLPRQDQLQEILYIGIMDNFSLDLIKLFYIHLQANKLKLKSFEQIWLTFVMQVKYNKSWDGENWDEYTKTGANDILTDSEKSAFIKSLKK